MTQNLFNRKLKNSLCNYLELLASIETEILYRNNTGLVGNIISQLTKKLFQQMIIDSQITLYDPCLRLVINSCQSVQHYGVKQLDSFCRLYDQFHISVVVVENGRIFYLNQLSNPNTKLFQAKPPETDYLKAICHLKQQFTSIRDTIKC